MFNDILLPMVCNGAVKKSHKGVCYLKRSTLYDNDRFQLLYYSGSVKSKNDIFLLTSTVGFKLFQIVVHNNERNSDRFPQRRHRNKQNEKRSNQQLMIESEQPSNCRQRPNTAGHQKRLKSKAIN